ncbi:MAG TPA: sterol desaturase family protein [Geobacteraceae bacterium]|nr:sterol desaturase family protein [Geobacteraceae bacterium]
MASEATIRLSFFFGTFALVATWELIAPRRQLTCDRRRRWFANLSLVLLDTLAVRLLLPVLPVGMALAVQERGIGLLNALQIPVGLKAVLAIAALDFVIYLQHRFFHAVPIFWRIHRMHHTDLDLDVTSGNRFHPLEIIISMGIKLSAITLIGAPPIGVLLFEVILNSISQFNHGNIRIPLTLDRWLRLVLVTPDMHRVHHSVVPRETNSNYGFNLPWWDRLCGTYRSQPEAGHLGMTIGLREFRDPGEQTFVRLLVQPFLSR